MFFIMLLNGGLKTFVLNVGKLRIYIQNIILEIYLMLILILYLKQKKNLSNFFFLLDFDYLDNDIIKISSKLNLPSKQFEIKNTKKYNSPSLSDLNVIKKYNEFDTQLYDYFKKEIKI